MIPALLGLALVLAASPSAAAQDSPRAAAAKREVAEVYARFTRAVNAGDATGACDLVTDQGRAKLLRLTNARTCAGAIRDLRPAFAGETGRLADVRIFGVRASGRVVGTPALRQRYRFFTRGATAWKVADSAPRNRLLLSQPGVAEPVIPETDESSGVGDYFPVMWIAGVFVLTAALMRVRARSDAAPHDVLDGG